MEYNAIFVFNLTCIFLPAAPTHTRCADGYAEYNNKCWKFSTDVKTWHDAKYACGAENAYLATINSEAEMNFVYTSLSTVIEERGLEYCMIFIIYYLYYRCDIYIF